jgi:hypothetical protein
MFGTYKDDHGYNRSHTSYSPALRYGYTVNGQQLEGTELARVRSSTNRHAAEARLAPYPVGKQVMVYCDPNDPNIAYLEVKRSFGGIFLLCFGIVLMIPALILWTVFLFS